MLLRHRKSGFEFAIGYVWNMWVILSAIWCSMVRSNKSPRFYRRYLWRSFQAFWQQCVPLLGLVIAAIWAILILLLCQAKRMWWHLNPSFLKNGFLFGNIRTDQPFITKGFLGCTYFIFYRVPSFDSTITIFTKICPSIGLNEDKRWKSSNHLAMDLVWLGAISLFLSFEVALWS